MPLIVRTLISQLLSAGFIDRGGKGSHRNFRHPSGVSITISQKPRGDAKQYQVRDVALAIKQVQHEK